MKRIYHPLCFLLLAFFLVLGVPATDVHAEMLSINGNAISLRSGPGTKYRVMWELDQGFPLEVLKRTGDWYRVRDFEGTVGWVHRNEVADTPYMIVKTNKKSKKQINLRSGPGTSYQVVARANHGVVLKTLEQEKGWVKVQHEQGVTGWVKRNFLWGW